MRAVVTGESPIWLLGAAIVLVASLMLITALRRKRD
ncbi:LPXTG cell wall anchor domain-containing protein [Frondihabitans sucicola]|nr:LPXTG cell wall anchor domain-containing protein [Frondihabitans sucicola]